MGYRYVIINLLINDSFHDWYHI